MDNSTPFEVRIGTPKSTELKLLTPGEFIHVFGQKTSNGDTDVICDKLREMLLTQPQRGPVVLLVNPFNAEIELEYFHKLLPSAVNAVAPSLSKTVSAMWDTVNIAQLKTIIDYSDPSRWGRNVTIVLPLGNTVGILNVSGSPDALCAYSDTVRSKTNTLLRSIPDTGYPFLLMRLVSEPNAFIDYSKNPDSPTVGVYDSLDYETVAANRANLGKKSTCLVIPPLESNLDEPVTFVIDVT